jgi:glucose/arabinose dehydrogenase
MTSRFRLIVCVLVACAVSSSAARATVAVPAITEPEFANQVISPYDVHMVAGPFVGSPGENHVCSDWELRVTATDELVWSASCVQGTLAVHIHLGDGQFTGSLTGDHELRPSTGYTLRVRFLGDAPPPNTDWSDWATRPFLTASASVILPLILSDIAALPAPRWLDGSGQPVLLPAGDASAVLRLEAPGGGTLLQLTPGASGNQALNPPPIAAHGPVHVYVAAGGSSLDLPASHLLFTDGSGQDRDIALPPIALAAGGAAGFWVDVAGDAFAAAAVPPAGAAPDFTTQVAGATIPWAVRQPGFVIDLVASELQLPVNIAFLPSPGSNPTDPFFYVTELYGNVQLVTRNGSVSPYATGLLNFDPLGSFPGSGEKGLTGIVVEPASGDLFVSAVEAVPPEANNHFPRVMRLHSADGGLTMASQTTILDFPTEPLGPSHQISNLTIGPDGKLYVHIGDGLFTTPALDLTSVRGKILRVNLDGSAPTDNPFYATANGVTATQLIFAYGLRNPFGGAWRQADGAQWEVENGPSVDRLAKIVAGRNYLWDGTDASMANYAAYNWSPAVAPVNIAFVQPGTFGGSSFPAEKMDHAFVTESGPTYAPGPQGLGKRISEFSFDLDGNLTSGPLPLIEYIGAGRATATALAAGPDGLYFGDLYEDFGESSPVDRGAHVFRIRYVGVADFTSSVDACVAGQSVSFTDASSVPGASAWRWDFGDGAVSSEQNPVHVYESPGSFDVRLTVTGSGGDAVRQKAAEIAVAPAPRTISALPEPPPATRTLEPR